MNGILSMKGFFFSLLLFRLFLAKLNVINWCEGVDHSEEAETERKHDQHMLIHVKTTCDTENVLTKILYL